MEMKDILAAHTGAVEAKLAEFGGDIRTLDETIKQVEQKFAYRGGPSSRHHEKSYGEQIVSTDRFKSFAANGFQGKARFELKAITSAQAGTAWSGRDNELASFARRRLRVRDLLTVVPTVNGSIDYARQTVRTNNAAPVAEAALKPTSVYAWEQATAPVRTIAHLAKLTRQALEDSTQLATEIENEMRYGLGLAEEAQLLSGDGTGQNLFGLIPNATAYAAPFDPVGTENMIDMIGLAVLQQSLTEFPADGIVVNSADWMRMRLLKDADGKYLLGDPAINVQPALFGLPVVATQAMTIDKFLVGGFGLQKLYDRMAPEVLIASENATDFENNLLTMRAEERLALIVRQPTALVYGDFGNV